MAEENNKFSVDADQLKNEAKDTVNKVKDTIKNVDIKKDAKETRGFVMEIALYPFETVKKIASGEENILNKAVIIMLVFIIVSLFSQLVLIFKYGVNFLTIIGSILMPIVYVLVPSIIVLILNRQEKKPLTNVIATMVVANVPLIFTYVLNIFECLASSIALITNPINTVLTGVTVILSYIGMKELFGIENDDSFIKKYILIQVISSLLIKVVLDILL